MNPHSSLYFNLLFTFLWVLQFVNGRDAELCSRTSVTEIDRQPWWQVDLGRDYVITELDIVSDATDIRNFEIKNSSYFIGASLLEDGNFNNICDGIIHYTQSTVPKYTVICKEPMLGRFVMIAKLRACKGETTCPLNSLSLSLCEVKIRGYNHEVAEEKVHNLALDSIVTQSGTVREASLAVDGLVDTKGIRIRTPQCAIITKHQHRGPLWSLRLPKSYKIEKVVVYTNETISDNLSVTVMAPFATSCAPIESAKDDAVEFDCKQLETNVLFIVLNYVGSLVLCEVEVFVADESGFVERSNVALGKPTKQSSVSHDGRSHLAVDGEKHVAYYRPHTYIARCTHSDELSSDIANPWWRVDLLQEYIISTVNVYNRGEHLHARLHDIEIRIGNHDFVDYDSREDNPLCFSNPNSNLEPGKNVLQCVQEVVGRFVSIQIVRPCLVRGCRFNILTLCEVEVYGEGLERVSLIEKNVAVDSTFEQSPVDFTVPTIDEHPWLLVNLTKKSIVDRVVLVLKEDIALPFNFSIKVGEEAITRENGNALFEKNLQCSQSVGGSLKSGENKFKCRHPLVGQYVSIQITENCLNSADCIANYEKLVSQVSIQVWGYFYHEMKPLKNVAFHASTSGVEDVIGNASLAVDGVFPPTIYRTDVIKNCAKTDDVHGFPWFQVELRNVSLVQSVSVVLPGDGDNYKLRDFEVRVGFSDISAIKTDKQFSENAICFKSESALYSEGFSNFPCKLPMVGKYVTIQIVDDVLKGDTRNVLQLCEVMVNGYPVPENFQIQDLSKEKSVFQSSIDGNAIPSLSVDGRDEITKVLPIYFQNCSESTSLQCTVDTSQLRDCSEVYKKGCTQSGIYVLSYVNAFERIYFSAFCDMETDNGGWTVFQRRNSSVEHRVKFEQNWEFYRQGFGDLCGEFWFGNEVIHNFGNDYELMIDLTIEGKKSLIKCKSFGLEGEKTNYTAHVFYCYGDIEIGTESIDGKQFQIQDRNFGDDSINGGWWFSDVSNQPLNLNGEKAVVTLFPRNKRYEVEKSEMKLRPIGFLT